MHFRVENSHKVKAVPENAKFGMLLSATIAKLNYLFIHKQKGEVGVWFQGAEVRG